MDKHCDHCLIPFEGRSNQLYCSKECRRANERARARLRRLLARQIELERKSRETLEAALAGLIGYHDVRLARAKVERNRNEAREVASSLRLLPSPHVPHSRYAERAAARMHEPP